MLSILLRPAFAFRTLADSAEQGSLWRGPISLLFVFGCVISLLASGRLTIRLIADGMVSFAFIPLFEVVALAIVMRRTTGAAGGRAAVRFARAVDLFFAGQLPWVLWLIVVGTVCAFVPPRELGPWIRPAMASSFVPLIWSLWIDFHFFRQAADPPPASAYRRLIAHRLMTWTAIVAYFLGIAIWHEVLPEVLTWLRLP